MELLIAILGLLVPVAEIALVILKYKTQALPDRPAKSPTNVVNTVVNQNSHFYNSNIYNTTIINNHSEPRQAQTVYRGTLFGSLIWGAASLVIAFVLVGYLSKATDFAIVTLFAVCNTALSLFFTISFYRNGAPNQKNVLIQMFLFLLIGAATLLFSMELLAPEGYHEFDMLTRTVPEQQYAGILLQNPQYVTYSFVKIIGCFLTLFAIVHLIGHCRKQAYYVYAGRNSAGVWVCYALLAIAVLTMLGVFSGFIAQNWTPSFIDFVSRSVN